MIIIVEFNELSGKRYSYNMYSFNISIYFPQYRKMKRRTLSGSCAIGLFMIAFICVFLAFVTPSWIVSDYRITGAKLDRLGLWTHCFRSLADPNDDYNRRFFVGCRWVFDPFTTGYDEIRGFLIPRKFNHQIYHIFVNRQNSISHCINILFSVF